MATVYSDAQFRTIFQSPFELSCWIPVLRDFFKAKELKARPQEVPSTDEATSGYYLGNIDTNDSYRIGLFHYKIKRGSVANKLVGLRNLVRTFINPSWGEFDAALVTFDSGDHWRLSFISDIKGEETHPKRYSYVFGNPGLRYNTPLERFELLKQEDISFSSLRKAFSVEALSDKFFDAYREHYADFVQYVTGKRFVKVGSKWEERTVSEPCVSLYQAFREDDKKVRDYIKKMLGRITFLHFLQRKGWMNGDLNYMQNLFERSTHKDNFLDAVLEPLFFGILNTKPEQRQNLFEDKNWDLSLLEEWRDIPYLNGGLFEQDEEDKPESIFPAELFCELFSFFGEYNFTIDENDPRDAEIGVDPEMLGKIFENLLEDNKDKGAFYTPKEIVQYMCQEALISYLRDNTSIAVDKLEKFVLAPEENASLIPNSQQSQLLRVLKNVKICDPAIGSGAFPMGLLNELVKCRLAIAPENEGISLSALKKSIISNNIYGVDIEKGAVDIARLRFWLSIVVDEQHPTPLPNLDYKIMQGNSLIESYKGVDLSRLSYKSKTKARKKDLIHAELWSDELTNLQKSVTIYLDEYFSCSDKENKAHLQEKISDLVQRQLATKGVNAAILDELSNINLAANNQFFLWQTWFAEVFNRPNGKNGFDIVIGNPPYIDSETMVQLGQGELRTYISKNYKYIKGNWDIYMAFLERGLSLSNNCMCYITPDKWLSKPFGVLFREHCMIPRMNKIVHTGNATFDSATVDAIISIFNRNSDRISAYRMDEDKNVIYVNSTKSSSLTRPYYIDSLFSEYARLIDHIDECSMVVSDFASCDNACATSDAYKLIPLIQKSSPTVDKQSFKLVNTGTVDKFFNKWGQKEITYLGIKEPYPVVNRTNFSKLFGRAYVERAFSKKIILKGLNLLDGFIDFEGSFIPGKSTLVVCSNDDETLKFLAGILNTKLALFYIKVKYSSSSYCGGITFSKEMINNLPIPSSMELKTRVVALVNKILDFGFSQQLQEELNRTVYEGYGLSEAESLVIEKVINK